METKEQVMKHGDLKPCPLCGGEAEANTDWLGGEMILAPRREDLPGIEWTRPGCLSCRFNTSYDHWQSLPRLSDAARDVVRELREALCSKCDGDGCDDCEETGLHGASGLFVRDVASRLEQAVCKGCLDYYQEVTELQERVTVGVPGGYMTISDAEEYISALEKLRDSWYPQLGKLPWVRVNHGVCGSPSAPMECIDCEAELDGLWCRNCGHGISIRCPHCNVEAVTKHARGIYYCARCEKEFCAHLADTIIAVSTTADAPICNTEKEKCQ